MSKKADMDNITSDPFDEFEFKPLTSGLGFHKVDFKSPHLNFESSVTNPSRSGTLSSGKVSSGTFNLESPLPRQNMTNMNTVSTVSGRKPSMSVPTIEDDSITKAQTAVNEILKNLNHKKQLEESLSKNQRRLEWKASRPSFSAGFLDTMLITAFFLLSLIAMLAITKIDLIANMTQPDPQYLIYWATFSLLAGLQIIYYVSCRAFLGFTPGEWAFDQRCGNELQLASSTYVLRVTARSFLNTVTGFVVMPLISALVKFDVLGALTGTQIQRQKN